MQEDYQRLLVALDIYSTWRPVLERALKIAKRPSDCYVMYVTRPLVYFEPYGMALTEDVTGEVQQAAKKKMLEIAEEYEIPESQIEVPVGSPAESIHDFANEIKADLIVLGTHGQSGVSLILGSTANAVLHGVKRDVLAVRV